MPSSFRATARMAVSFTLTTNDDRDFRHPTEETRTRDRGLAAGGSGSGQRIVEAWTSLAPKRGSAITSSRSAGSKRSSSGPGRPSCACRSPAAWPGSRVCAGAGIRAAAHGRALRSLSDRVAVDARRCVRARDRMAAATRSPFGDGTHRVRSRVPDRVAARDRSDALAATPDAREGSERVRRGTKRPSRACRRPGRPLGSPSGRGTSTPSA